MTAEAAVPSDIDGLTGAWLSAALGAPVVEVEAEQIAQDTGFSSLLYRLHLTGDGVPPTLIAKLPAQSEARGAMELLGGYRRELAFYQDVAGRAPMETPRVYTARMVPGATDFVFLLEDLQHWDNADHLAGLSMNQARLCIDALAGLHAWSTDDANAGALDGFPSIDTPIARDLLVPAFGPGLPVAFGTLAAFQEWFRDLQGWVDFQFASRGVGAADVAYLVSQGLPTEVRRGHDKALVRDYLERLAAHGVSDYSFDEAWRHYRFAVAYLMVLPVITLNGWDAMPERSRALCLTLTDRAVATIDEIDAVEVFA